MSFTSKYGQKISSHGSEPGSKADSSIAHFQNYSLAETIVADQNEDSDESSVDSSTFEIIHEEDWVSNECINAMFNRY